MSKNRHHSKSGMTLLEMTVVILVLLSLITILFVASRAWKNGSDRSICIVRISSVQKGVRGYANLYGYSPGSTVPDLYNQIIGFGKFIEATPRCPSNGTYTFGEEVGIDTIPAIGTLYMRCSLADSDGHEPKDYSEW